MCVPALSMQQSFLTPLWLTAVSQIPIDPLWCVVIPAENYKLDTLQSLLRLSSFQRLFFQF